MKDCPPLPVFSVIIGIVESVGKRKSVALLTHIKAFNELQVFLGFIIFCASAGGAGSRTQKQTKGGG